MAVKKTSKKVFKKELANVEQEILKMESATPAKKAPKKKAATKKASKKKVAKSDKEIQADLVRLEKAEAMKDAKERAAERIRRSKVSSGTISMYLSEISQYEPLAPEKEVELAVRIAKGDKHAMKELVEANLRFVVSVAKKYQGNGLSLSDIINEGNLGLIKAAKRFDPSRGFKFISYAVWWIRQAILQALAEQGRLIRLPLNRVGTITKITKAAEKLEAEMGRPPKVEEISHQLEVKTEKQKAELSFQLLKTSSRLELLKGFKDRLLRESQKKGLAAEVLQFLKSLTRELNRELQSENYWDHFERNYRELHEEFSANLKKSYPDLTKGEIRLSYLLRQKMSNKEVANVLNVSPAAVEKAKYRLKKKLGIDKGSSLDNFIQDL